MAKEVIKRDGSREPFDPEKIRNSIAAATQRANLSEERKNEAIEEITSIVIQLAGSKEVMTTSEIREKILSELDGIEPGISAAWRAYDREKKGM